MRRNNPTPTASKISFQSSIEDKWSTTSVSTITKEETPITPHNVDLDFSDSDSSEHETNLDLLQKSLLSTATIPPTRNPRMSVGMATHHVKDNNGLAIPETRSTSKSTSSYFDSPGVSPPSDKPINNNIRSFNPFGKKDDSFDEKFCFCNCP
eukprot:UN01597